MHTKTKSWAGRMPQIDIARRLISIWKIHPTSKRLVLSWSLDDWREKRAIEKLKEFSDHELSDIGLSRSDLTPEGLAIAGAKRSRRQDTVAMEIATLSAVSEKS